jgi:hypothetical protein
MNGRIYDPLIGRFMSADPYIQAPDDLQSFNRYAYVSNNPLNYTDPSGYKWLRKLLRLDPIIGVFKKKAAKIVITIVSGACGAYAYLCKAAGIAGLEYYHGASAGDAIKAGAVVGITSWVTQGIGNKYPVTDAGGDILWDNVIPATILNGAVGCASAVASDGNCADGARSSAGSILGSALGGDVGVIVAGCITGNANGGSCKDGATDALKGLAINHLAQGVRQATTPKPDDSYDVAQIRSIGNGGRGTAGGAVGGGPIYDDGTPVYGTGIPRAPQFNFDIRNLIGFPVSTIIVGGWQWIMSVNDSPTYPTNPDNGEFKNIRGTGASVNPEDDSVWERDNGNHGRRDGDPSSWKRWKNERDWRNQKVPQTIWPDGRIRK